MGGVLRVLVNELIRRQFGDGHVLQCFICQLAATQAHTLKHYSGVVNTNCTKFILMQLRANSSSDDLDHKSVMLLCVTMLSYCLVIY